MDDVIIHAVHERSAAEMQGLEYRVDGRRI